MSTKKSAASTPFFARYLEGQGSSGQAQAEVRSSSGGAYAKAKAKKKAATKAAPNLVTLKFPSDSDEVTYVPYYQGPKYIPVKYREPIVTLKYPSDSDEYGYVASYLTRADVPKAAVTGAVKAAGGKIQLKKAAGKKK